MRHHSKSVGQRELLVLDLRQFVSGLRVSGHGTGGENRKHYGTKIAKGNLHRFFSLVGEDGDVRIIREMDVGRCKMARPVASAPGEIAGQVVKRAECDYLLS
jgi:hypothetical protein